MTIVYEIMSQNFLSRKINCRFIISSVIHLKKGQAQLPTVPCTLLHIVVFFKYNFYIKP